MDPKAAAAALADPLGAVAGATFYFSPQSAARASAAGLDVVTLYAGGRGAVLGDVPASEVDEVFFFFKTGLITGLVETARKVVDVPTLLAVHLGAADDFAMATFGGIDDSVLAAFDTVATSVVDGLVTGAWPLVDGYRAAPVPPDLESAAFRRAILLRELRGGVHRDAVIAAGLTAAEACQFDRGDDYYRLHGFGDEDLVEATTSVLAARDAAVASTDEQVGRLLSVLDAAGLDALVAGAQAMDAAWRSPAEVSRSGRPTSPES
jgi:hypothetical protein